MDIAADEEVRKQRIDRIQPFLRDLCAQKEPKTNKAVLLVLVQDLKDEGNSLFKEGKFAEASDHYRYAVFVADILEERYYHEIANDFLTTLYANGALCYLKLDKFEEALHNSEEALKLQPENLKAKYRKVQALMGLKQYEKALKEAQDGLKKQPTAFQDCVAFLEQTLTSENSKKSAYAAVTAAEEGNEWLADTNALRTEKLRKAVLKKMPKKKKGSKFHLT